MVLHQVVIDGFHCGGKVALLGHIEDVLSSILVDVKEEGVLWSIHGF